MKRHAGILLTICLFIAGCGGEERKPSGTARLFLRAVAARDTDELYRLLAPRSREQLESMARLATDQTGGRRRFKPQDLIVLGMTRFPSPSLSVDPRDLIDGSRATVRLLGLLGRDKKTQQVLNLIHVDGRWRVELPLLTNPASQPLAPASRPTSRPAR